MSTQDPTTPGEPLSHRLTRRLGVFLARWGVAMRPISLVAPGLAADGFPRGHRLGSRLEEGGTKSALKLTAWMNAFMSLVMAGLLVSGGVGTFLFSTLLLGFTMTMGGPGDTGRVRVGGDFAGRFSDSWRTGRSRRGRSLP